MKNIKLDFLYYSVNLIAFPFHIKKKKIDVPGSPEDISVHDIFQDSCVLKWKKPKDDGGMPITNYIIERQDLSVKGK